jgi:hypothetical protein
MTELKFAHFDQMRPAVLVIKKIENRRHDRTPPLIKREANAAWFPGVFLGLKNGFVGIAGLFRLDRLVEWI